MLTKSPKKQLHNIVQIGISKSLKNSAVNLHVVELRVIAKWLINAELLTMFVLNNIFANKILRI
jgi:hypothetical protein